MPGVAQEIRADACATPAYSVTAVKYGVEAGRFQVHFYIGLEDGRPRDVCCDVLHKAFESDVDDKVVDILHIRRHVLSLFR